jgi:hypothetical protein
MNPTNLVDPERNKKRVELALTVSTKIAQLAAKKRGSFKTETKEEREERTLVSFPSSKVFNFF